MQLFPGKKAVYYKDFFGMFGLGDTSITLAMAGCIFSAALCVIYGAINWNNGNDQNEKDKK